MSWNVLKGFFGGCVFPFSQALHDHQNEGMATAPERLGLVLPPHSFCRCWPSSASPDCSPNPCRHSNAVPPRHRTVGSYSCNDVILCCHAARSVPLLPAHPCLQRRLCCRGIPPIGGGLSLVRTRFRYGSDWRTNGLYHWSAPLPPCQREAPRCTACTGNHPRRPNGSGRCSAARR